MFKIKYFYLIFIFMLSSGVAAESVSMRTVNGFRSYMIGPGAPKELREGALGLGAIHRTCYGKITVSSCKEALRQSGKQQGVKFLESFEKYLPKLMQFKTMKEELESGRLNPYEPSNHAVYLRRNCTTGDCLSVINKYVDLQAFVRKNCSLSRRSNQNEFTVGMSWSCYEPVMAIPELESELLNFKPPLNAASNAALNYLNQSAVQKLLDRFDRDSVFTKCDKSSPLVNESICRAARLTLGYFNVIKQSIEGRGVAEDGTIDIERNSMYAVTNDYKTLSPDASGDKFKGYRTVQLQRIFDAMDADATDFLRHYEKKSKELESVVKAQSEALERQKAKKEKHANLLAAVLDTLGRDGYTLYVGSISNVLSDMQNGELSRDDIGKLVIPTRNIEGRLQEIKGSMLIFSQHSTTSYKIALSKSYASQIIVSGSLAAICDCSMVRIKDTLVQGAQAGSLVQVFEIEPYTNSAVEDFARFTDQSSQAR